MVWIYKARRPTGRFSSMGGPREYTIYQGHQEGTGEKGISITKKFCDGFSLQVKDANSRSSCTARLINIHGDEGALK